MNPFVSGPALLKVMGTTKNFLKHKKEFEDVRKACNYKAEQDLILKYSGEWAEETSERLGVKYDISGEENIPEKGSIMIYSNHQGLADILALLYLFRNHFQIGFISKNEWRKIKPLAEGIEYTRSVFLIRENPREALKAIVQSQELLSNGFSLAIFPEGTRSQGHEMGECKPGSFKFAEKGNVPILPITLDGSYKMFEETGNFKAGQTIKITVHPLVHIENMSKAEQKDAEKQIVETIKSAL